MFANVSNMKSWLCGHFQVATNADSQFFIYGIATSTLFNHLKIMNMDLQLEIYGSLCETSIFTINGVDADQNDFGDKYDHDPENAEDYGCGDMRFDGQQSTPEILTKYSITQSEYDEVVSKLSKELSFRSCGWCV